MNFSFQIKRLGSYNKRCQFYTIVKDDDELTEAVKFLNNKRIQNSPDFNRLLSRQKNIKNRHGARINYFKPEGTQKDLVYAFHAGAKKRGYLQINRLRWYCIRLSERCVIFGNGGVKEVGKTQEDDHLNEKESDMRWVDRCLDEAFKTGDIGEDADGNLRGIMDFNEEVIEKYGL